MSYFLFFFCLKFFRIIIRIFSEKILIIILGLELKMFSLIPLLKKTRKIRISSKKIYFIFQTLGSIFLYLGIIFFYKKLIFFGILKKMIGFPLIWFPLFLSSQNKIFLILWICFFQKLPLYFLFKEIIFFTKNTFCFVIVFYFLVSSFGIVFSFNLFFLLAWSKVLHSFIKILLI